MALLTHGQLGLPVVSVAHYALVRLRARGLTLRSIRQELRAVALCLEFFSELHIDFVLRAAQRRFLSREELVAFADRCRISVPELGSRLVSPGYAASRYFTCIDYVKWVAEPVLARITDRREHAAALEALVRFEKRASSVAPRVGAQSGPVPGERLGMTSEQRELFLRVIRPGDPDNPFKPELQLRTAAMLLLAYALGPRAGELLGLKCSDFDFGARPATLTIHRRHDDPEDRRLDPASTKTNGRILTLEDDLRDLLDAWITQGRSDRKNFPSARKHPFVFVNYRGNPLTERGLRLIVAALAAKHHSLAPLSSHILRHDWNDRWNEMTADSSSDPTHPRDQKYAMGWTEKSIMPLRYGKRSIRNSANKKIEKMQMEVVRKK
ncbi:tyrosine-type recombinase/integrase [Ralstonia chuxiongensis]|uniref:tyrosine-type recombinase/integrase n=1 Tax=Ralstonia chuxiongensis TaxID=2957504 RepID=UPI0029305B89|nr:tyrosine-type recombinase/integrase [Ralstonia chuxiongensis]